MCLDTHWRRVLMKNFPDHPVITEMETFGYIRDLQELEIDEDAAYEERRERENLGEE